MTYTVFSKPGCPNCDRAKALLKSRGFAFNVETLNVGQPQQTGIVLVEMAAFKAKYPEVKALPMILEDDMVIGGYAELYARLNLLNGNAA